MMFRVSKVGYQPPFVLLVTLGDYSESADVYTCKRSLAKGACHSGGSDFQVKIILNYLWVHRMFFGAG